MAAKADPRSSRRYWVWVTGPDYYLDEDESERQSLDPSQGYEPGGWWSCHRDTEEGDLVLLYRTKPRQDLAYLFEARSAAYSILDDNDVGWDYGCDFEVVEKFARPLKLEELKGDRALGEWGALRAGFRRRVYEIPPDAWNHLLERLTDDRAKSERLRRKVAERYAIERDIENRMQADLSPLRSHGYRLEARARQYTFRRGGRADLICFDGQKKRYVVIEIKRGLVSRDAIGQLLSYRASIAEEFPARRRPHGLLVGDRLDNQAQGMVEADKGLGFVSLGELPYS